MGIKTLPGSEKMDYLNSNKRTIDPCFWAPWHRVTQTVDGNVRTIVRVAWATH